MQLDGFLEAVATRAPDLRSIEATLTATDAVLAELGRYVAGPAAERLASELPAELTSALTGASAQAEGGSSEDFFAAVAGREGVDLDDAPGHVQAVFRALARAVDGDALRSVAEQLTPELRQLLIEEREGDTSQWMAAGPVDPGAANPAGPERRWTPGG